ncbi:MAG TPA: hypothetical protein DD412_00720 [Holosporales bacterium]|nr:hypothetical protein [Holosporales bacterium]
MIRFKEILYVFAMLFVATGAFALQDFEIIMDITSVTASDVALRVSPIKMEKEDQDVFLIKKGMSKQIVKVKVPDSERYVGLFLAKKREHDTGYANIRQRFISAKVSDRRIRIKVHGGELPQFGKR